MFFTCSKAEVNQSFDIPLPNSLYEKWEDGALLKVLIRDYLKIAIDLHLIIAKWIMM